MNVEILIAFVGATAALALSPGPDNIYVLIQSLSNGKAYGMVTVCGLITGCIIHTSLLAFGLSAIIKDNDSIYLAIRVLGALYLLYLAYSVYRSNSNIDFDSEEASKKTLSGLFVQGFFMNVLNPKVTIFFLAFFPGFLFSEDLSTVWQFYILGGIFMLVSFIIFSVIALLASQIKRFTLGHKSSGTVLKWLQIVVFIGIAVFILV